MEIGLPKEIAAIVYEVPWNEIPEDLWPMPGRVFVCKDPQKRFAPHDTWAVSVMGNGTFEEDTIQLGLFWNKDVAVYFADMYALKLVDGGLIVRFVDKED